MLSWPLPPFYKTHLIVEVEDNDGRTAVGEAVVRGGSMGAAGSSSEDGANGTSSSVMAVMAGEDKHGRAVSTSKAADALTDLARVGFDGLDLNGDVIGGKERN
mmetsp:Transcript_29357/g.53872  ORF Transcript_29357/g.53872 Transcript_29357/m.53872 type:complete len:103 (-) Transcript_29357:286-594(-)